MPGKLEMAHYIIGVVSPGNLGRKYSNINLDPAKTKNEHIECIVLYGSRRTQME